MCTSVPQIEVFLILMSTSFGPGTGTGTSVRSRPGPGLSFARAGIIVALIGCAQQLLRNARLTIPNVAMIRDYGWRAGCLADGVTDAGVGSDDCRLGFFLSCAPRNAARHQLNNRPTMAAFSNRSHIPDRKSVV